MKKYDVIVIGSGGGSKIITPAAKMGYKVACIEKDRLGGTCLNRGCIPSKMLIYPAYMAHHLHEMKKFDIHLNPAFQVDFARLITRISRTVDADSDSIETSYQRNPNIDFYHAPARFINNETLEVNGECISADKIFIAVGARPHIPPIDGLSGTPFLTSTEALRNARLPQRLIVIGAGYIAVELGFAYRALGCEVDFLVRSRLLRKEDTQVATEFTRIFTQLCTVHCAAIPTKVEHHNGLFRVTYKTEDNRTAQLTADALLIATGVTPNTDNLGLEHTDIRLTNDGFIRVDSHLRTSVDNVYALGDCVGNYLYRHTVNFEGEHLFRMLFIEKTDTPLQYPPVPHAVFSYPQIAGVGKTEDQLKKEGVDYVVGLSHYKNSGMGMALLSDHGFCKILVEGKTRKILGAHIVGEEASDMIHILIAFMNKNGTLDDLLNMIYIHPALPEVVRNAARKAQAALEEQKSLAVQRQ